MTHFYPNLRFLTLLVFAICSLSLAYSQEVSHLPNGQVGPAMKSPGELIGIGENYGYWVHKLKREVSQVDLRDLSHTGNAEVTFKKHNGWVCAPAEYFVANNRVYAVAMSWHPDKGNTGEVSGLVKIVEPDLSVSEQIFLGTVNLVPERFQTTQAAFSKNGRFLALGFVCLNPRNKKEALIAVRIYNHEMTEVFKDTFPVGFDPEQTRIESMAVTNQGDVFLAVERPMDKKLKAKINEVVIYHASQKEGNTAQIPFIPEPHHLMDAALEADFNDNALALVGLTGSDIKSRTVNAALTVLIDQTTGEVLSAAHGGFSKNLVTELYERSLKGSGKSGSWYPMERVDYPDGSTNVILEHSIRYTDGTRWNEEVIIMNFTKDGKLAWDAIIPKGMKVLSREKGYRVFTSASGMHLVFPDHKDNEAYYSGEIKEAKTVDPGSNNSLVYADLLVKSSGKMSYIPLEMEEEPYKNCVNNWFYPEWHDKESNDILFGILGRGKEFRLVKANLNEKLPK